MSNRRWGRVFVAIAASALLGGAWLPVFLAQYVGPRTPWMVRHYSGLELFQPVLRLFTWFLTLFAIPPMQRVPQALTIVGLVVLAGLLLGWVLPAALRGLRAERQRQPGGAVMVCTLVLIHFLLIVAVVVYGLHQDLTLSVRYFYSILPLPILLVAIGLGQNEPQHRRAIAALLTAGFLSSMGVALDFSFRKPEAPATIVQAIQQVRSGNDNIPVVLAGPYTQKLLSLAWGLEQPNFQRSHPFSFKPSIEHSIDRTTASLVEASAQTEPKYLALSGNFLNAIEKDPDRAQPLAVPPLAPPEGEFEMWLFELAEGIVPKLEREILGDRRCQLVASNPEARGYPHNRYRCEAIRE